MKKVVERERNKIYYRVLHVPIWIWVFWILPGHLTRDLFQSGPDRRHWIWLAVVTAVCAWRGFLGRLPGAEPKPYVTYWGVHQPNLWYRVVCYTAAWIDLIVPYAMNALGILIAAVTGRWMVLDLYTWLYYPLALAIVLVTVMDGTPRPKRSTRYEGAERAWFYVAIWTVVPSQLVGWAAWRLGGSLGVGPEQLVWIRLVSFFAVTMLFLFLGVKGRLPRTKRYHFEAGAMVESGA